MSQSRGIIYGHCKEFCKVQSMHNFLTIANCLEVFSLANVLMNVCGRDKDVHLCLRCSPS